MAKQVPARAAHPTPEHSAIPVSIPANPVTQSQQEQLESLNRLVAQGAGYIQISRKNEDIYIALTDSVFHDLGQRPGLTVYHAAHLIELTDEEIRLLHSLRTIKGPGGSVDIQDKRQ